MKRFYIISNQEKDPGLETAKEIKGYLESHSASCEIAGQNTNRDTVLFHYTDQNQIPTDTECILVLGGDGTLLHASRDLVDRDIPMLGINMGTLGFLAEIDRNSIKDALDSLLEDRYTIEERMMLEGEVYHQNRKILEDIALNDVVLGRTGKLRVIDFNVFVNGVFLCSYSADGIIFSTPTGSTGYNLSAGGPVVMPDASLIVMTAIAPHTLNSRPVILPDQVEVMVEVGIVRNAIPDCADVIFDGDSTLNLNPGDRVMVRKSGKRIRLVKLNNISFLEALGRKMGR